MLKKSWCSPFCLGFVKDPLIAKIRGWKTHQPKITHIGFLLPSFFFGGEVDLKQISNCNPFLPGRFFFLISHPQFVICDFVVICFRPSTLLHGSYGFRSRCVVQRGMTRTSRTGRLYRKTYEWPWGVLDRV